MSRPPAPPPESQPKRGGWLGAGIMVLFLVFVLGVLALAAPGFVLIVLALLAFVGLNYLIWGKWLGGMLNREAEEEQDRG